MTDPLFDTILEAIDAVHDMDVTHADYAREIAKRVRALVPEWQPIETAPKDGEVCLIYKPEERRSDEYTMAAYWSASKGGFVPVGGTHKQGYYSEVFGFDQGYPTKWMPLPLPPAEEAGWV